MGQSERPVRVSMRSVCKFAGIALILCWTKVAYPQISDFGNIDFKKPDSIADLYPSHSLKNLPLLSQKLTAPLTTEVEKFRSIYRWVCENIDNDYGMFIRNKRKREKLEDPAQLAAWNENLNEVLFRRLLNEHRTICTGYAYLLKELCLHAGLDAEIIHGYGRNSTTTKNSKPNHSWNAVKLNGKWYLSDPTWSAGVNDPRTSAFIGKFDEAYFLSDPAVFIRKHYPVDTAWTLLKHKPTFEEFDAGPIVYSAAFNLGLDQLTPNRFTVTAQKDKPIDFSFTVKGNNSITSIALQIHGHQFKNTEPEPSESGLQCVKHTFHSKGKFIVHVAVNDRVTHSYSVIVE